MNRPRARTEVGQYQTAIVVDQPGLGRWLGRALRSDVRGQRYGDRGVRGGAHGSLPTVYVAGRDARTAAVVDPTEAAGQDDSMAGLDRLHVPTEALAALCREFGVAELSVFGSALRDDFRADSDVDLLVVFDAGQRVGLFHLMRLQHRLEDLLGRPVDLVPKSGLRPQLREQVLANAQRVYAA